MKKKELERLEHFPATRTMLEEARKNTGKIRTDNNRHSRETYRPYKHYRYFLAKMQGDYLVVGLFLRKELVAGKKTAHFYIYMTKEDFITYDTEKEKWSNAKIDALDYKREKEQWEEDYAYASKQTEGLVNTFFGQEKKKTETLILKHQREVRKEQLTKKHRRIEDEIDRVMETVPPEPKGFADWLDKDGTYSRYIFYHAEERKKRKSGWCSSCNTEVLVKDPYRNEEIFCPHCRKKVFLKPWRGQKTIHDRSTVVLWQKLTDGNGYVLRKFKANKIYRQEKNWKPELTYHEETRDTYNLNLTQRNHYEYGRFKSTTHNRWCFDANEPGMKGGYYNEYEIDEVRVYPGNIRELRKDSIFKYVPLEVALRRNPGYYLNIRRMMRVLRLHPEIEYLIKLKLYKLSIQYLDGKLELKVGKTPWEKLGVTKEQLEICQKHNGGERELKMLQSLYELGYRADWKQVRYLNRTYGADIIREILPGTTIHKLIRYTELHKGVKHFEGDYVDYLRMARKLEWDINQSDIRFPKNFKQKHDEAAELVKERENRINKLNAKKKDAELKKLLPALEKRYAYEDETYKIVFPTCKKDFTDEGQRQHICVGSAGYFENMLKGKTVVFFLRRKEELEKSFCTVEMDGFVVRQCRAAYNADPGEDVHNWMEKYRKIIEKREIEEAKEAVMRAAG